VQVERRAGAGGQGPAVSELGPEAAGELTALSGAAYPLTAGVDDGGGTGEQVAAELADPNVLTIGVREPAPGQQLLGAASVRVDLHDPGVADVARLVIQPGCRHRGLAGLLLRAAERRLPGHVRELWLQVCPADESSLRFYARRGYREAHRDGAPDGVRVNLVKHRGKRARQAHPRAITGISPGAS